MIKLDDQWTILSSNHEWIRFSDTKAIVMITAYGVIGAIVYTNAPACYAGITVTWSTLLFSVLAIILGSVSAFFSFYCLNPILKNPNPHSLVYFGHIQAHFKDYKEYHAKMKSSTEDHLYEAVSEQIYYTSVIAWKKFKRFALSLRFFAAAMLSSSIAVVLYLAHS